MSGFKDRLEIVRVCLRGNYVLSSSLMHTYMRKRFVINNRCFENVNKFCKK